jgi:hypothetical protein
MNRASGHRTVLQHPTSAISQAEAVRRGRGGDSAPRCPRTGSQPSGARSAFPAPHGAPALLHGVLRRTVTQTHSTAMTRPMRSGLQPSPAASEGPARPAVRSNVGGVSRPLRAAVPQLPATSTMSSPSGPAKRECPTPSALQPLRAVPLALCVMQHPEKR